MTYHFKPHIGPTEHKGNLYPCPNCGRRMTRLVLGAGKRMKTYLKCRSCQTKGLKKAFVRVEA